MMLEPDEKQRLFGIFRGVVEDNDDPLKTGRVRVRIWGLHSPSRTKNATDGIPTDELPWAEPCLPVSEGGISGYGIFSVPLQGSHVMLFFENGNIMSPRYFASVPGINSTTSQKGGFNDPDGIYPEAAESDWNSLARDKYPENMVIAVHGGHYIELDSTEGAKRVKVYHAEGVSIEITNDKNITISGINDQTTTIDNDVSMSVGNDASISIGGDITLTVTGNVTVTATGDVTVSGTTVSIN